MVSWILTLLMMPVLALQEVSGFPDELILTLLTTPVLGSSGSEWLPW